MQIGRIRTAVIIVFTIAPMFMTGCVTSSAPNRPLWEATEQANRSPSRVHNAAGSVARTTARTSRMIGDVDYYATRIGNISQNTYYDSNFTTTLRVLNITSDIAADIANGVW